jgi:hypothetical protein
MKNIERHGSATRGLRDDESKTKKNANRIERALLAG